MVNFLIIFEQVPEETKLFLLKTNDPELIVKVRQCHNKFVGLVDTDSELEEFIANLDTLPEIQELDMENNTVLLEEYCEVVLTGEIS